MRTILAMKLDLSFRPKPPDTLQQYSRADIIASVTVGIVTLPLGIMLLPCGGKN